MHRLKGATGWTSSPMESENLIRVRSRFGRRAKKTKGLTSLPDPTLHLMVGPERLEDSSLGGLLSWIGRHSLPLGHST